MISRNYSFIALVGLVFVLAGCGAHKPSYKAERLNHLSDQSADYTKTKNGITVRAKKFIAEDNRRFFGEHNEFSQKDGIVPIQLTVENTNPKNSRVNAVINATNIDLPLMSASDVASKIDTKSSYFNAKAAGIGLGTSFVACSALAASAKCLCGVAFAIGLFVYSAPFMFVLPGFAMMHGNPGKSDINRKMLDRLFLYPGDIKSGVIFVRSEDYKSRFDIQVTEKIKKQRNKLNFSVNFSPVY